MIILDTPGELFGVVRRHRERVLGRSRRDLAGEAAEQRLQDPHVVTNHWSRWERGERGAHIDSPALQLYLRTHGLRLAVVADQDEVDNKSHYDADQERADQRSAEARDMKLHAPGCRGAFGVPCAEWCDGAHSSDYGLGGRP